jgi:hypothetical protein
VHETAAMVERTGRRAPDGDHLVKRDASVARALARRIRQGADDRVGPVAWRTALGARDDLVMVIVKRGDDRADLRAAEVDAEEVVVAQTLGSLPASSGDDSTLASPSRTLFCAAL